MICDLNVRRPFEGLATAELKGLPPFSATTKIEFDANTSQLSFPIQTEDKARAGLTKNLFCFVRVPMSGELITHTVGQGGQIRLDNPPPQAQGTGQAQAQGSRRGQTRPRQEKTFEQAGATEALGPRRLELNPA